MTITTVPPATTPQRDGGQVEIIDVTPDLAELWLTKNSHKAWNAYRNGDTVSIYRWRPGGAKPEQFPEPV